MTTYPSGIKFPFRFAAAGGVEQADGGEKVMSNLKALALSAIKDRLIRKVGTVGYKQVLRASLELNSDAITSLIREAATRYEPRAIGLEIKLYSQDVRGDQHTYIDLAFIFRYTGDLVKATVRID